MRILKALVFISCIVLLSGVILAALAAPYFCLIWLETQHSFVTSEMVALSFVALVVVVLLALGLGKIYFAIFDFLNEKLELRWGYWKFRIDSQTEERLARLLEGSTAETNGDVLKYALATYEMLLEARKKGHQILIREPEEDAKFILPGTPEAPTLTIVGDD